ncbi:MAG: hypothetical protein QOH97_1135 [Actinoplanes sp.]|jgi:hypothetical protein|nr:hypothetical protein [Actinoplanes sp.]
MKAPLGRWNAKANEPPVGKHMVGNALVLHTEDQISPEAQTLALTVREDDENEIVLLDLQGDMPVGIWESVAHALNRRRSNIRLVVCGQQTETTVLAGQWLSERLNRTVIAPNGYIIRGADGALFVHAGENSGWVRYRPGKTPTWDAKRFPQPLWDIAATELMPTSSAGVAEPLPGGVWIRDTRDIDLIREHWQWLVTSLPCQPHALAVVLGCPGTPPLPLDDIARFWRELDEENRRRVRFVHYGPVQVAKGETLGQTLADLLSSQVICFGGVPVGDAARPQMHTVTASGELGWQVFARELSYTPRTRPTAPAVTPHMLSHRAPLVLGEPLAPMVYWYANDAVIEVIQSGLWMRPMEAPRNADSVRAAKPSAEHHTFIFDDATEARAARMRALAEDVIARLDPATRERSALVAASRVSTAYGAVEAGGQLAIEDATFVGVDEPITAEDWANGRAPQLAPAPTAVGAGFGSPEPAYADFPVPPAGVPTGEDITALRASQSAFLAQVDEVPAPATMSGLTPRPDETGTPVAQPKIVRPRHAAADEPPVGEARLSAPEPATPSAPAVEMALPTATPVVERPVPEPRQAGAVNSIVNSVDAPPPPVAPAGYSSPVPTPPAPPVAPSNAPSGPAVEGQPAQPDRTLPPPPTITSPAPPVDPAAPEQPEAPAPPEKPRFQPTPEVSASALLTGRGLEEERGWLRRTLSRDFDSVASSISRVLSEHPGLQGGDAKTNSEILSDSVAVRLYLSPQGAAIDAGLRSARKGPHVPFARCVVSGLSRLPSHRGATMFAASPSRAEWKLLSGRSLLTDWGFLNALTAPSAALTGDVDVLIWAMTARRTALLEPAGDEHVDNRVLFMPGTNFKVLDIVEPSERGRGQVLIRELSANEIDSEGRVEKDRVSFDELATASLRRCAERWSEEKPTSSVGVQAVARFSALPGLV